MINSSVQGANVMAYIVSFYRFFSAKIFATEKTITKVITGGAMGCHQSETILTFYPLCTYSSQESTCTKLTLNISPTFGC
jgi:hypothetical protein